MSSKKTLHWLSFCDPELPNGSQFWGVCIIDQADFCLAIRAANFLEINPGGEVQGVSFDGDKLKVPEKYMNKLMQMPEISELEKFWSENCEEGKNG